MLIDLAHNCGYPSRRGQGQWPNATRNAALVGFQKTFATEEACFEHLRAMRWPDGSICPRCGHDKAWYIWEKELFERLIRACVSTLTITYQELVAGKAL
ncbi:MAG: transposase [Spirochaetes bacterium]|nr:transposase [Spirochaetota bacterium]